MSFLCDTVKVGQAVRFVPSFLEVAKTASKKDKETKPVYVVGRVYKVNRNGVIHVEYPMGDTTLRESFTGFDFGTKVSTVR